MSRDRRVGVLVSGSGTNLQALLDATARDDHPATVGVVVSNRPKAKALERAERAGVATAVVPHRRYDDRPSFERALLETLEAHDIGWVALAGFMRLLTPTFLDGFPQRVLNIHPSLLPAFPGTHAQAQAFDYGVRIAGVSLHFVDAGTDTGPIIAQAAVPVRPDDTHETLQQRLLSMEHALYPTVLRWAVEGRLQVEGRTVRVDLPPGEETWMWGG